MTSFSCIFWGCKGDLKGALLGHNCKARAAQTEAEGRTGDSLKEGQALNKNCVAAGKKKLVKLLILFSFH